MVVTKSAIEAECAECAIDVLLCTWERRNFSVWNEDKFTIAYHDMIKKTIENDTITNKVFVLLNDIRALLFTIVIGDLLV